MPSRKKSKKMNILIDIHIYFNNFLTTFQLKIVKKKPKNLKNIIRFKVPYR